MFESIIEVITTDLVGVGVQLFFAYTIVLMIRDTQKPPIQTAVLTGLALIALSLGGSFTSVATSALNAVNGLLWLTLAYQRYTQKD